MKKWIKCLALSGALMLFQHGVVSAEEKPIRLVPVLKINKELDKRTEIKPSAIPGAGDGLFAAFDGPARATRCAWALVQGAKALDLRLRVGVHTGECEVLGDKYSGIAVHIGARLAALSAPGEVLVSSTVKELVAGSGLSFEDRGQHALKGVPGHWHLYAAMPPS